jgi:hypothetical protein
MAFSRRSTQEPEIRVFGCIVIAKVPNNFYRKLGEKAFRGIIVGYQLDVPNYRIYNLATRRITKSMHALFQEDVPGYSTSMIIDSMVFDEPDMDSDRVSTPHSHPLDLDPRSDDKLK